VVLPAVIAAQGAAFAVLAGLDGSATWQAARVLLVATVTAWAVWFTRRAGRAGQGATALLFGITGTAAGAGAGSAHLAKAGLDAAVVLAAVVLTTGAVLLVWGAAMLVRAMLGWWRLLAVPMALALLWFVLLPLTVAVNATSRPPGPLGPATPARYGLGYRDVAFRGASARDVSRSGGTARRRAHTLRAGEELRITTASISQAPPPHLRLKSAGAASGRRWWAACYRRGNRPAHWSLSPGSLASTRCRPREARSHQGGDCDARLRWGD
jgi:hypothetical protein